MNYGELRSHFLQILNRSDCSNDLADTFITSGLRRIERLLRTPIQRVVLDVVIDETTTASYPIPADYLGLHEMMVNGVHVPRIAPAQLEYFNGFHFAHNNFNFTPELQVGDTLTLEYYSEFTKGVSDGTTTAYSLILSDTVVYAALVFACTYFVDARKAEFAADFATMIQEIQLMADIDEMSGRGIVMTPYGGGIA